MARTASAAGSQPRAKHHSHRVTSCSSAGISWRDRPHQQLSIASEIAQLSEAALYRAEKDGLLTFVRLSGRTLVETTSLIAFIARAEPWTASNRGAAARAKRAEVARAALTR